MLKYIGKYGFEFLSIFVAVVSAFALNSWKEGRNDFQAEQKILLEIRNGLRKDTLDIRGNIEGHKQGIESIRFFRRCITLDNLDSIKQDSLSMYYLGLTRDFIAVLNTSGFEALKSKGLEIISDDSLRAKIIDLYEFDYKILKEMEEDYDEMNFHANYFPTLNPILVQYLVFDNKGNLVGLNTKAKISESDRKIVQSLFLKMQLNRMYMIYYYNGVLDKIRKLDSLIKGEG
jgi:hypothetical protein